MDRAQSRTIACQCVSATSTILTVLRYKLDPITWALTVPGPILRSITAAAEIEIGNHTFDTGNSLGDAFRIYFIRVVVNYSLHVSDAISDGDVDMHVGKIRIVMQGGLYLFLQNIVSNHDRASFRRYHDWREALHRLNDFRVRACQIWPIGQCAEYRAKE